MEPDLILPHRAIAKFKSILTILSECCIVAKFLKNYEVYTIKAVKNTPKPL